MTADVTPLLAPLASLSGVAPRNVGLIAKVAGGTRVVDLLFTLPESMVDRRARCTLAKARKTLAPGTTLTTHIRVLGIEHPQRQKQPFRIRAADETDEIDIVFFHGHFIRGIAVGDELAVSGKFERYGLRLSMPHPDYMVPWAQRATIPLLDPVWPLTAGLFPSAMRRAVHAALATLPDMPEWLDAALVEKRKWPDFSTALRTLHAPRPDQVPDWDALSERARSRLAFDELLADQLCIGMARLKAKERPGRSLTGDDSLRREALKRFGFTPTHAQNRAIAEIDADLAAPRPMMRLLQGDVGAGKTLVAAMAMLRAVEAGAQAALMAPTEILARQHFTTLSRLCPVPCVFLSGNVKGKARKQALEAIASGHARIAVGTHALFQDKVAFHDLALAVIDEQHRFGVHQRMSLAGKGATTDVLVMTATPIPRTLLLTQWGELTVSRLDEKPPGRLPIQSSMHALSSLDDVLAGIGRAVTRGVQVYWVCPLVEESEVLDVAAAEARWAELTQRFGTIVGLAHGKQDIAVRQAALEAFRAGETRILVATTVIEVGVDVPNASVMVIEHAERFGLAQLHQLRGRVGRGAARSFCLLLFADDTSQTARRRLSFVRDTEDGFQIADEDFRTRGGGDLAGSRQSGLPGFRLASGIRADLLLTMAWQERARILESDPALATPRGRKLQNLLRICDRSNPDRLILSG